MANEVLKCLSDLYKLAAIKDDYTTQCQISAVLCNIEDLLLPSNGVAPSSSNLDVYLSNLFNPSNGLPVFINKFSHIKTIQPLLQSIFQLFFALLDNYVSKVIQYAVGIKEACMKGILSGDTSADCKKYCFNCLERLIAHCSLNCSLQSAFNAESVSNQLFNLLALSRSKLSCTELTHVYTMFGLLGRHFPVEVCAPDKLIRALCNELNSKEVKEGKGKPKLVECCLNSLSDLLSNPEYKVLLQSNSSHLGKIYAALKSAMTPMSIRHLTFRAALKLFSDHTDLWSPLVVPEYVWWHSQLTELLVLFESEADQRSLEQAINKFYVLVAKSVTQNSESVKIYKYFMDYFTEKMGIISTLPSTSESGRPKIIIKGLSRFVECNVANSEKSQQYMATMFDSFLQRTLFLSLELQKLEPSTLEYNARLVSNYLFLLFKLKASLTRGGGQSSTQPRLSRPSTQSGNSLLHICINLVTLYPRLDYASKMEVSQELSDAWATLYSAGTEDGLLNEFVYQSIIRTCSHDLIFDADNLPDHSLVTFRAYLPLWKQLLSRPFVYSDGKTFRDLILDQLLSSLVLLCHKLDLRADLKSDSELSGSLILPSLSHAHLLDPGSHLSPSNRSDLTLFANLVDFYSELLLTHLPAILQSASDGPVAQRTLQDLAQSVSDKQVEQRSSENATQSSNSNVSLDDEQFPLASRKEDPQSDSGGSVTQSHDQADSSTNISPFQYEPHRLASILKEVISVSRKHPVVGGLYSLCALLLRLSRNARCFKNPDIIDDLSPVMDSYLDQVISVSIHQQQDLRFVCLSLILATPLCFIRPLLPRLVQPLQIIFELGLSDMDLAEAGLSALTQWVANLPPHVTRDFVTPLLSALAPYLKSRDSSEESVVYSDTERALLSIRATAAQRKKKRKLIESCEQNSQLRSLQTSIVYFLSMVGSNQGLQIVSGGENGETLREKTTRRLLFNVPFLTSKVPIHLDIFMDHLVSLGSSSSNRRLRVAACELLHCTTLLLLGNNKQDGSRKGNERDEMFEKILPVIIKLGCDGDILVRQLFSDLATQLMHYYSSELQLYTSHSQHVITTLMNNITHDSQTELRDFSSRLLAEYLAWTRKQAPKFSDPNRRDTKQNMAAVVKQIQQYCVHPVASKRIGAAIALNSIYKILREEVTFIDKHWLDLFFHLVQNLALCSSVGDNQILCESINHMNRVVKEKSKILNTINPKRSKPNRFESLTLGSFLRYLYEHLNHANAFLRSAVRKIIVELSPHASTNFVLETELPSIHSLVQSQLSDETDVRAVNIALENYLWMMSGKQNAMTTTNLLLAPQSKLLTILNSHLKYLHDPSKVYKSLNRKQKSEDTIANKSHQEHICQLIVSLLKLTIAFEADTLRALFDPSVSEDEATTNNQIINRRYFRLVANCLFQPHLFGFNTEQREDLRTIMDHLLCEKCRTLNDVAKVLFEMLYRDYVQVDAIFDRITEPYRLRQQRVLEEQRSYLEALTLIQKSGLFPFYIECINSSMVDSLFNALFESSQLTSQLTPNLRQYSQLLFEFLNATAQNMSKLVDCLIDARPYLNAPSKNPTTKGQHFFSLYRSMVTPFLLNHLNQLESLLLTEVTDEKLVILTHLVEAVTCPGRDPIPDDYCKLSHSASSLLFKSTVLTHWNSLALRLNTDNLVTLLTNIIYVKPHCGYLAEFQQVVEWYLNVLESPSSTFQDKLHYLRLLPSFLNNTMASSEEKMDWNKDGCPSSNDKNLSSDVKSPSADDKNPSTPDQNPSSDDQMSLDTAHKISLESRLLSIIQSLLSPIGRNKQSSSPSQDDSTCHFLLVFAELQRALPHCLNWGLFKLLAEFSCKHSVMCDKENRENRLDFVSCLPHVLTALSSAHYSHLVHTLYTLLTRPCEHSTLTTQSPVTQSTVDQSDDTQSNSKQSNVEQSSSTQSNITQSTVNQSDDPLLDTTRFRHAMLDVVFLPTLREMFRQSSACAAFYRGRMQEIHAALAAEIDAEITDEADVRRIEESLLRKLIHVRVMEGILHVPSAELPESLENERKQVMKSCIYSNLLKCNRRFDQSDYCSLLTRELHTAAYVACCIWICNTGADIKFYSLLFKEQPDADKYIFKHFLPADKEYHFPIEFSVLPQQKKLLTGIRCSRQQGMEEYRTSVDLFSSSLADDVFRHDFTSTKILRAPSTPPSQNSSSGILSLTLELDEINSHEAMQALTAVLHHLKSSDLFHVPDAVDLEPLWFRDFLSSLQSPGQARNVRVWLVKLVVNCRDLFGHYAEALYPALFRIVTAGTLGSHINYFLNDLLLALLSWHSTALPPSNILRDFLAFMFQIVPHAKPAILKYNLEMIRNMLSVWSRNISSHEVPHETLYSMISNPDPLIQETGLQLSEIIVNVYRLAPCNFSFNAGKNYLDVLVQLLKERERKSRKDSKAGGSKWRKSSGESDVLASLIGGLLGLFKSPEEARGLDIPDTYNFKIFMESMLRQMAKCAGDTGGFLRTLYFMSRSYPPIVDGFLNDVILTFPKLPVAGDYRTYCLSLLGSVYTRKREADMWTVLKQIGVLEILDNKQHGLLLPALKLLSSVKRYLDPVAIHSLLPCLARHADSNQPLVRTPVYELVYYVFDRWVLDVEERMEWEEEGKGELVEMCKEVVLKGLLDEDQSLQDQNYSLLAEHYQSTPPAELITRLFRDLYVPSMEPHLLNFVSYFILYSTRHSPDFSTPLFSHPLEACDYRQHRLLLSYRHRNLTYAPLFVNSLASQVLGLTAPGSMAAPGSMGAPGPSGQYRFQLRGTGSELEFEPTAESKQEQMDEAQDADSSDNVFLVSSPPDSVDAADQSLIRNRFFKLSYRFRRDPKQYQKREAIKKNYSRNFQRIGLHKEKQKLKSAQVSLTRSYRTGDFPDIQITYREVLEPLRSLCVRDSHLSRLLVLSLYQHLSQQQGDLRETSVVQFKRIMEQGMNDPNLTSLILEIFCEQGIDDVTHVNQVAKTSGLIYHGIWFTENKVLANIPNGNKITADPHFGSVFLRNQPGSATDDEARGSSSKRLKMADETLINAAFTELIDLYKSIDETDIINGILSQQHNTNLRKAIDAELTNNYRRARKHYEACLVDGDVLSTAIIRDGYYRTFHEMSKWNELQEKLAEEVEGDWHKAWAKDKYVMSNLLRCQILKKRDRNVTSIDATEQSKDAFLSAFKVWTESNPDHFDSLKLHHAQDSSILHLLLSQYPQAVSLAELNLNQQLLRWRFSGSTSVLDNALVAMETALISKTLGSGSRGDFAKLSHVWDVGCSEREELATLEVRVLLRSAFIEQIGATDHCDSEIRADLQHRIILNQLRLIDTALHRNRFYFARDKLYRLFTSENEALYGQAMKLYDSRVNFSLCMELRSVNQKLDKLLETWRSLEEPGDYEKEDLLKVQFYKHVCALGTELIACLQQSDVVLNEDRRTMLHDVFTDYGHTLPDQYDVGYVQARLFQVVVDGLRKTIVKRGDLELGDEVCSSNGECHLLLAEFIKTQSGVDATFPASSAFIQSLLLSIKCGTVKARQLFPLLLQMPDILQHGPTFSDIVRDIPSWMFLLWLNQILAYLDQDIGSLLLPLVQRLATEYPNAVKLPFNINAERYASRTVPGLLSLIKQLKFSPQEANLYNSLSVCTLPGSMLKYHLEHIYTMDKSNLEQLQAAIQALHNDCFVVKPGYNEAVVDHCAKYRHSVSEVFRAVVDGQPDPQLNDKVAKLLGNLADAESKKRSWELKQVSQYLSSYGLDSTGDEMGVEVPGQYGGFGCPRPEQHVRVAQFRQNIRVMQSIKKPIQITIVGNNGEEYPWLIKHNEDLRSDERIQAVFSLYNSGLQTDSRCGNRELSLATYRVVPLRPNSGMIQWVPHTRVLGELYQSKGLTKDWLNKHLGGPYQTFHQKSSKPKAPNHIVYENSMKLRSRQEVTANYLSLANKLPKYELRDGLLSAATSPENRIRLRNNFVRSYAAMCIAHYTLGIGDRHLENTLVCSRTGRCIGIDFGMAFGVATQLLPIPELLPFRLTPHVLAVNAPYGSGGLIRESMVRVLSCLRSHSDVILCTLQVFIREPCSDWLVMLRRKVAREGSLGAREIEERGDAYMQWYPEAKIKVAEQKLAGHSSTFVMNQELELRPSSSRLVCSRLVSGPLESARNVYEDDTRLSVVDQVDCLLDHATDVGILGVTWVGWAPYV